jgi:hypothetical protein
MAIDQDKLAAYFENISKMKSEEFMDLVEKYMDDDTVELFVDHIEDFYGVSDDEELGMLANIMIAGFVCAKELD